jgi:DNA repair protein RadC
MQLRGPQSLSNADLIAILLRTGTKGKSVIQISLELILKFDNIAQLALQSVESLSKIPGIGRDKASTLVAAFELSKRIDLQKKWFSNKKISSPADIAGIFIPLLRDEVKERFIVVCLNSSNKIIKYETISIGTLNSSLIHAREVFKVAIENNSANIILVHNHPSGNAEPSKEDIEITKKLFEAGNLLDIKVFDHIIVAQDLFTSLVERKII